MDKLRITKAGAHDFDAIFALEQAVFGLESQESLTRALKSPSFDYFKAEENGHLIGYIATNNLSPEGEILSVAVDENARNNGVGKALLSHALWYLKTKGVEKVFLEVAVDNVAAIALYRGAGFDDLYVRKDYYNDHGHGVDALILVKSI